MAKPKKKIDKLTKFEWNCLVGAWRYFGYLDTIISSCLPADIIKRYWTSGKYADSVLFRIANQFAIIDHGVRGETDWWERDTARVWCVFYRFCEAWVKHFTPLKIKDGTNFNGFWCDRTARWYDRDDYIRNGGSIYVWVNFDKIAKEGSEE